MNETMIGMKFDRLTIVGDAGSDRHGHRRWQVRCQCGRTTEVLDTNLRRGLTRSCGCRHREIARRVNHKHGFARKGRLLPEYRVWLALRERCSNPKHRSYKYYGERGIRVDPRWNDFSAFLADVGRRPSNKHSIDRYPNNDGDYAPNNVRWATAGQQALNRRRPKRSPSTTRRTRQQNA